MIIKRIAIDQNTWVPVTAPINLNGFYLRNDTDGFFISTDNFDPNSSGPTDWDLYSQSVAYGFPEGTPAKLGQRLCWLKSATKASTVILTVP